MTEDLKKMVEAMVAEFERQARDEPGEVECVSRNDFRGTTDLYGHFNLEAVASAVRDALNPTEREHAFMLKTLGEIRVAIVDPGGPVSDTLWISMIETVVDRIDGILEPHVTAIAAPGEAK